jgi:nucleoid-associated protein YgaU
MAIALTEIDERTDGASDLLEVPWPRPMLRVVAGAAAPDEWVLDDEAAEDAGRVAYRKVSQNPEQPLWPHVAAGRQIGTDVAERRRRRAAIQARRRAVAAAVVVGAAVVGLALPLSVLGGRPASVTPSPSVAAAAGATVYVVQPGDTLWSIAQRLDGGGNPRPLAEALARETGSATVVPGERIAVP